MVLDVSFLASAVVTVMIDGLCCAWQTHEEAVTREVIRQDIRKEFERQARAQEPNASPTLDETFHAAHCCETELRRRQYRTSKIIAEKLWNDRQDSMETIALGSGCEAV